MKKNIVIGFKPLNKKVELIPITINISDDHTDEVLKPLLADIEDWNGTIFIQPTDIAFNLYSYLSTLEHMKFLEFDRDISLDFLELTLLKELDSELILGVELN